MVTKTRFQEVLNREMASRHWEPINLASAIVKYDVPCAAISVWRWMEGATTPRLSTAGVIADIFSISLDEFFVGCTLDAKCPDPEDSGLLGPGGVGISE